MGFEGAEPAVVPLDAEQADDATVTGAKAANLARAAVAGLPVLPGFVLVPADRAPGAAAGEDAVRSAWRALAGPGERALVVRSSSAHEDTEDSSMAGRFESVLDVRGWEEFTIAVQVVLDSARKVRPLRPPEETPGRDAMAVLVQPMVESAVGGVMFGADPVEGRIDRILVSAVPGGPHQLVDGSTQGVRYQLTRFARLVRTDPAEAPGRRLLSHRRRVRLVDLAKKTERAFGGPQDMEFGFDADGKLWLFQARPITAMAARPLRGARLLGPGPVAETLPGVLQPLEEDLWVAPMSHGLTLALDIAGAAPRRHLRRLPLVTTVEGRAAADLRLLGAIPSAHPVLDFVNPAPGVRRAGAAWRIGRLRSALPLLAVDLMADVDRQLSDFPPPREMLSGQLLDAVAWGRHVLSSLHAQESLAGALLGAGSGATAAGEALAQLTEGRRRGLSDERLLERHPVLLALLPPSLGDRPPLPAQTGWTTAPRGVGALPVREGLRLRIRWVQEMQAQLVRELAQRVDAGECGFGASRLVLLRWEELVEAADGKGLPSDLTARLPREDTGPLPAVFRLADGRPVAQLPPGHRSSGEGQGAGGGFGTGTAWDGHGERPGRPVLVVRSLDPALAPLLPGLAGLVAETGSALSHLAVLAREYRVPTAVGVPAAVDRFLSGTPLTVDGGTGEVAVRAGEAAVRDTVGAASEPASTREESAA
ncbi:PEP/pyruvate-binding domain-containing protein [Streptomyces caniscabiei]|uniref:PEP/pyruvate-binding domain-containing protein n=1 Tax=Streptomyces caniscabiei TaxID=2746961 RepID=UPI0029B059F4|nr:PEP/pyruvate-binding domain-containing protein [Streptomyces caniscabiei]MDX3733404.1 PEP/pyruvate-binding domain-containing protein [Streptomyces caniscabiei]